MEKCSGKILPWPAALGAGGASLRILRVPRTSAASNSKTSPRAEELALSVGGACTLGGHRCEHGAPWGNQDPPWTFAGGWGSPLRGLSGQVCHPVNLWPKGCNTGEYNCPSETSTKGIASPPIVVTKKPTEKSRKKEEVPPFKTEKGVASTEMGAPDPRSKMLNGFRN